MENPPKTVRGTNTSDAGARRLNSNIGRSELAIPLMLVLAPALASAFHMPAAVSLTRSFMHALGSRPHMVHDSRKTVRSSVLALRAQMPPPPPETGSRTLSKAELADLNIQLLEAGQYLSPLMA